MYFCEPAQQVKSFTTEHTQQVNSSRGVILSAFFPNGSAPIPPTSYHRSETQLKNRSGGFPGGAVVENLPANAGDTGSSPGLGKSHMPQSNWAREPQLLSLRIWSLCPATGGAAIVRGLCTAMKSGPRLPQLEKALARNEDPTQLKINK